MKIGIDAKSFFNGPVSTRIVLQNLLPELFRLYPDVEWVVFLDEKDKGKELSFGGAGIQLVYVWAGMNQLSNLFVLPRYCKALGLDLVVYQTFPALTTGTASIAFVHDVLFRDFPQYFTWKERLYFVTMPFLTRRAARVTATTSFVAKDLIRYGYVRDASRIDLVPLGVSPAFRPLQKWDQDLLKKVRSRLGLPGRFLLFVGRLNVRKNLENLLKALPLIGDRSIPLVVVGTADWKAPNLEALLATGGIGNRVIMTGSIGDEELLAVYAMATIFCFPSFAEGFGLPPLEAMASGVPVIVADRTALPEVCGDAGVFVDPSEPPGIAHAINGLLNDTAFYHQKRAAGLQRAALYSWDLTATALMKSILHVLGPRKS